MGYGRTRNTFILACLVDGCDLSGIILHDLIKHYGGAETFDQWRKARWTTTYTEEMVSLPRIRRD